MHFDDIHDKQDNDEEDYEEDLIRDDSMSLLSS